jgi:hypothetical protein
VLVIKRTLSAWNVGLLSMILTASLSLVYFAPCQAPMLLGNGIVDHAGIYDVQTASVFYPPTEKGYSMLFAYLFISCLPIRQRALAVIYSRAKDLFILHKHTRQALCRTKGIKLRQEDLPLYLYK